MEVVLLTPARRPRLADRRALLRALGEAVALTGLGRDSCLGAGAELHVVLVGGRTMARLNRAFRGHAGRTDVLAFGLEETRSGAGPVVAGEVYVCLPVAVEAARDYGTSVAHECLLYAVHGMLHLAGHDDHTAAERQAMRRAERRVLRRLREKVDFGAIFAERGSDAES